jgi:hypothetical protein
MIEGQLTTIEAVRAFALAGNATLTIVSKRTRQRFTFKVKVPENVDRERPVWHVSVLTGADNATDFRYLGTIFGTRGGSESPVYRPGRRSSIGVSALSAVAWRWFFTQAFCKTTSPLLDQTEVWHEGRCGRCGRKLTVPESVASGFGPECSNVMGASRPTFAKQELSAERQLELFTN